MKNDKNYPTGFKSSHCLPESMVWHKDQCLFLYSAVVPSRSFLRILISHLLFLQQVNTVKDAVPWVPNLSKKEIHINSQQISFSTHTEIHSCCTKRSDASVYNEINWKVCQNYISQLIW